MKKKTKFFIRRVFLFIFLIAIIAGISLAVMTFINKDDNSNNDIPNVDSNVGNNNDEKKPNN